MKRLCYLTLAVTLLFFISSCATGRTPNLTVIDTVGRETPVTSFKIRDINQKIYASFWYEALTPTIDLDGTEILTPEYLPLEKNIIDLEKYKKMNLKLEIHNPKKITYTIVETLQYKVMGQRQARTGQIARSNLSHRSFVINLPLFEKLKDGTYSLVIFDDSGNFLSHLGVFKYETEGVIRKGKPN